MAATPDEFALIVKHLKPFVPPLLQNALGNYLISATLRFGSTWTTFIWDAVVDRCWHVHYWSPPQLLTDQSRQISQDRYGARAVRSCLESPHTSRLQVVRCNRGRLRAVDECLAETSG